MAKKQTETPSLLETFRDFNQTKNIDDTTLLGVLEESFRSVIAKIFGTDENFTVVVNPDKGDFEITRSREIVADDEVEDPNKQIALSEARRIEPDFEVGEDCSEHIEFEDFGRRAILTLRQTLASKILELEHDSIYNKYKDREGEMVTAEVYQTWKNETLLVDEEKNDLLLPKSQQIPRDYYHKGDHISAVIDRVDNTNGNPKIYLSRTSPMFLRRLLEREIPEIAEGSSSSVLWRAFRANARKSPSKASTPTLIPSVRAWVWAEAASTASFANCATRTSTSFPTLPHDVVHPTCPQSGTHQQH